MRRYNSQTMLWETDEPAAPNRVWDADSGTWSTQPTPVVEAAPAKKKAKKKKKKK